MPDHYTSLFDLLKSNSIKEIEEIIKDDPSAAEIGNEQGITLLLMAAYYRNNEAITVIKRYKKQLSSWEAVCTGEADRLNELLEKDPFLINASSPDGFSLLGYACFFSQDKMANSLISIGADVNAASQNAMHVAPLHSAAAVSNYKLCKLLLENGADVNAVQQGNYTPLHAAAQNGNTEIAKLLLDFGANKNLLTEKGESAVSLAIQKSKTEAAHFIANYQKQ